MDEGIKVTISVGDMVKVRVEVGVNVGFGVGVREGNNFLVGVGEDSIFGAEYSGITMAPP